MGWFSAPALLQTSFHQPLLLALECTALPCMVALYCLAPSCCTTPRKSSTRQRTILPTMVRLPLTQSTPLSASTWTPSTSSSGLQCYSLGVATGGSNEFVRKKTSLHIPTLIW